MAVIKIFLASSEELREDRDAFEIMVTRLNSQWRTRDVTFEVVRWEFFIDALAKDGLQKEYNKTIQACDIFVMLFFTKVGAYTLEEFESAFAELEAGTGPKIYTYFRNDYILTGHLGKHVGGLLEFKARLQVLKHYPTLYRNTEDLQWQFSRQLEMLYGGDSTTSSEINDATSQSKIGEIALVLSHRQLFGDAGAAVDGVRLANVVRRASRQVRGAILNMAQDLRRETWFADKNRMERTIPVFEALVQADPKWHLPYGNLGYALKDKYAPDNTRALELLTRAVELRGDRTGEGPFYQYSRALCLINLDAKSSARRPSDAETRTAILETLRAARRDLEPSWSWDQILENADATDIRTWLERNGATASLRGK